MKPTVRELRRTKGARLAMLTAYDYPGARLVAEAGVDLILVGDSLGMVVLGYDSTVAVTMDEMVHHTRAARRGAPQAFLIADLPFLSYGTPEQALANAARLMKDAGADSVKLEGGDEVVPIVEALGVRASRCWGTWASRPRPLRRSVATGCRAKRRRTRAASSTARSRSSGRAAGA
jgi:3-methyl-2-oxobutanoate hydroxymethyltransferase